MHSERDRGYCQSLHGDGVFRSYTTIEGLLFSTIMVDVIWMKRVQGWEAYWCNISDRSLVEKCHTDRKVPYCAHSRAQERRGWAPGESS